MAPLERPAEVADAIAALVALVATVAVEPAAAEAGVR